MTKRRLRTTFPVWLMFCVGLVLSIDISAMTYDTDGNVTLQWQANTEADLAGYNLYRATQEGGPYAKLNSSLLTETAFSDTQTTNGATYYYVVSAVDQVGNESGYSPESDACRVDTTAPTVWALPSGGYFYQPQAVELHSSEQAIIYYTTDGSTPTTSSPAYSSALTMSVDTLVKFVAVDVAGNVGNVRTATYHFVEPGADSDSDGMPDEYELEQGLDPFDSSDSSTDNDNDGYSNLQEFEHGTDPNNTDDYPTPPWVNEDMLRPHPGQGLMPGTQRVPVDTSVMIMLEDEEGVNPYSIAVDINGEVVAHTVHYLVPGDLTQVWVVYDSLGEFNYNEVLTVTVDANDINGYEMTPYAYSFKTETSQQHEAAANMAPEMAYLVEQDWTTLYGEEGTELDGVAIIYPNDETVPPSVGPSDEILPMDDPRMLDVLVNMEPTSYYETAVTVIMSAFEVFDISRLRVYYYNPTVGWVRAFEGDGWLVPGSRIEYVDENGVRTLEFQIRYAAPIQFLDASPPRDPYDVNRDMVLDSEDLYTLLSLTGHSGTLTDEQIEIGDLNGDGTVDMRDIVIILRELREQR